MTDQNPSNRPLTSPETGLLFALLTLLVWSSFHWISKVGSTSQLTVYDIAALRIGISAAVMAPWWLPRLLDRNKRHLSLFQTLSFSLIAGISYPLLAYSSYQYAPASHGAIIIVGLLPAFTAGLSWYFLKETPGWLRLACIVCVLSGVTFVFASIVGSTGVDTTVLKGDLMFAVTSLLWAAFTVLLHHWKLKAFDVTLAIIAASALIYLPIYLFFLPKGLSTAAWADIGLQGLFQGFVVPCVATFTYAKAIEALGATRTVMILSATPVVGTLMGVAFLKEDLPALTAFGVLLVFIGSMADSLNRKT